MASPTDLPDHDVLGAVAQRGPEQIVHVDVGALVATLAGDRGEPVVVVQRELAGVLDGEDLRARRDEHRHRVHRGGLPGGGAAREDEALVVLDTEPEVRHLLDRERAVLHQIDRRERVLGVLADRERGATRVTSSPSASSARDPSGSVVSTMGSPTEMWRPDC